MSDNPKDDDWGMTMPNVRLEDELKKDASPQAKKPATPSLPPDDWGISSPNVNIPNNAIPPSNQASNQPSDFDQTTPNINLAQQYKEQPKQSAPPAPPADDWGISSPNVKIPKDNKNNDDWQ